MIFTAGDNFSSQLITGDSSFSFSSFFSDLKKRSVYRARVKSQISEKKKKKSAKRWERRRARSSIAGRGRCVKEAWGTQKTRVFFLESDRHKEDVSSGIIKSDLHRFGTVVCESADVEDLKCRIDTAFSSKKTLKHFYIFRWNRSQIRNNDIRWVFVESK